MINHSCNPNAGWSMKKGMVTVEAWHPIAKGEQITHSYIDEENLALPRAKRRKVLKDGWGFDCCCSKCSNPKAPCSANDDVKQCNNVPAEAPTRAKLKIQTASEKAMV